MDWGEKPKKEVILPPRKLPPCQEREPSPKEHKKGRVPLHYDAFPRDIKFAYMTPGYYVKGFRISDVYKTEVDFSEFRSLLFLEDPRFAHKWGHLRSRIPYPAGRITDLPGTRDLHYRNFCLNSMTPESAKSWRKSLTQPKSGGGTGEETLECVCKE